MITPEQQYRKQIADLGICDDKIEKAIIAMLVQKDVEKNMAENRRSEREQALADQLFRMRIKYES